MKEILLSVKPEHLVKILNGEKTIEIRKTVPKCELPCRVWLYCTESRKKLYFDKTDHKYYYGFDGKKDKFNSLNGKVVGSFILNIIGCFEVDHFIYEPNSIYETVGVAYKYTGELQDNNLELLKKSCLTSNKLKEYLQDKNGDIIDKKFYGWRIHSLNILDKPFSLWDNYLGNPKTGVQITKAPQSWCYCKYDKDGFLPF